MRLFITFIILLLFNGINGLTETDQYILIQNKPVEVGVSVTFTISAPEGANPFVAWDFGDGSGLGRYRQGLSATYKFTQPGVYQVFARIQGRTFHLR